MLNIVLPFLLFAAAQWADLSPHAVRFVEVEPGVRLEVLDWGGSGEPVLLLAGHGDTAHVFDDFAPGLVDHFHVLALTRRGFGASSQPAGGYDLTTLVRDIARVVDAMKLDRVHIAGHSIAGDEMTRFAITYPEKTGNLIYLDAAYDRVDAQLGELKYPKIPPSPEVRESGSAREVGNLIARTEIRMPEAEIRATRVFGSDGKYLRPVTGATIVRAVAKMVEHPGYARIHAPVMGIFAVYRNPAELTPRYSTTDLPTRHALQQVFEMWTAFARGQRELFRRSFPQAKIDEIEGASHYVFISHRERVVSDVREFLLGR